MKKDKIRRTVCRVAISIATLLLIFLIFLGPIIKLSVNRILPAFLDVPASIETCRVNLWLGEIVMKKLVIGNPEGFESPHLFAMESLNFDMATRDLLRGKIHIYDITIKGPDIWYEQKLTSNNLSAFQKNLEQKVGGEKESRKPKAKGKKSSTPVVIDHILVDEGHLGVRLVGAPIKMPLAKIELNDFGKDGAMVPAQIVKLLFENIFSAVFHVVGSVGGAAVKAVENVGGAAVKAVGTVGGAAVNAAGSAAKAIGGIFSSGKNKEPAAKETPAE